MHFGADRVWFLSGREGASPAARAALQQAAAGLGGVAQDAWETECVIQRLGGDTKGNGLARGVGAASASEPTSRQESDAARELCIVSMSTPQEKDSVFCVLRDKGLVLQGAASLPPLLSKYGAYKTRATVQVSGQTYSAGDLDLAVGRAMVRPGERVVGLVLQARYLPLAAEADPGAEADARAVLDDLARVLEDAVPGALKLKAPAELSTPCTATEGWSRSLSLAWQHAALAKALIASNA